MWVIRSFAYLLFVHKSSEMFTSVLTNSVNLVFANSTIFTSASPNNKLKMEEQLAMVANFIAAGDLYKPTETRKINLYWRFCNILSSGQNKGTGKLSNSSTWDQDSTHTKKHPIANIMSEALCILKALLTPPQPPFLAAIPPTSKSS